MATRRGARGTEGISLDPVDIYNAEGEVVATFQSNSSLMVGDYGGGGSVGAANLRAIREMCDVGDLINGGGFGQSAWNTLTDRATAMYSWRRDPNEEEIAELVASDVVFVTGHYGYEQAFLRTTPRPLPRDPDEDDGWEPEFSTAAIDIAAGLADYPLINEDAHSELEHEWLQEALADMRFRDLEMPSWLDTVFEENLIPELAAEVQAAIAEMADDGMHSQAEHAGMYVDFRKIGADLKRDNAQMTGWLRQTAQYFINQLSVMVTAMDMGPGLVEEHTRANLKAIIDALSEVVPGLPAEEVEERINNGGEWERIMSLPPLGHTEACRNHRARGDAARARFMEVTGRESEVEPTCVCTTSDWADLCEQLIAYFREKGLGEYLVQFIRRIGDVLEPHFPALSDELKGYGS